MTTLENNFVSIVTPAWRAAATVGETIESVLRQTYSEWEMLVVDDCSPDDTRARVAEFSARDPRVKLLPHVKNAGPAAARNTALSAARGRWIAFLDSDDIWLPQKLERTIAHARYARSALTFTGFRRIDADGGRTGHYISVPPSLDYRQLLRNTAIATSTVLVDRAMAGDFRMKQTYYDDFACWLDILRPGRTAHGLDEDLVRYRVVSGSVSRNKVRSAAKVWQTYREVEGIDPFRSAWYFVNYGLNGLIKYRRF